MNVTHGLTAGVLLTVAVGCTSGPPSAVTGDGSPAASASIPLSPSASPSPSPAPSQAPARSLRPQPSAVPAAFPPAGQLAIGRHTFIQNDVVFSLAVTTFGWSSKGPDSGTITKWGLGAPQQILMFLWNVDGVYSDPCGHVPAPPVSPSAAELSAAVAAIPGFDLVAGPEDVTLGGLPGKHVTIELAGDLACSLHTFYMWYDDVRCGADDPCPRWATTPGQRNDVWIVETQGTHVWIEAETRDAATPETLQEVQQVIGSIQFE